MSDPGDVVWKGQLVPLGAHIYADRGLIEHHGIHVGHGEVVDLTSRCKSGGQGRRSISLAEFAQNDRLYVKERGADDLPPEEVVRRARSDRDPRYSLFTRNCEHVANLARTGKAYSEQMQ